MNRREPCQVCGSPVELEREQLSPEISNGAPPQVEYWRVCTNADCGSHEGLTGMGP